MSTSSNPLLLPKSSLSLSDVAKLWQPSRYPVSPFDLTSAATSAFHLGLDLVPANYLTLFSAPLLPNSDQLFDYKLRLEDPPTFPPPSFPPPPPAAAPNSAPLDHDEMEIDVGDPQPATETVGAVEAHATTSRLSSILEKEGRRSTRTLRSVTNGRLMLYLHAPH